MSGRVAIVEFANKTTSPLWQGMKPLAERLRNQPNRKIKVAIGCIAL